MASGAEDKTILTQRGHGDMPYGAATTPSSEDNLNLRGPPRKWVPWPTGGFQRRHFVAMMAFLGFANIYAMRTNLTIALLEMTSNRTAIINGKTVFIKAEFEWDSVTRGVILASFFYGYVLTQLPGGWLARRYGGKVVYVIGVTGTALLTMMTPPLALTGKAVLMLVRASEGIFEGVTFPAIHKVWSSWAPPMEKTKLATVGFAGSYFGTVVSMPVSAYLGERYGWPTIFYFFGLIAIMWCLCWFMMVNETPALDQHITTEELTHIQKEIGYTNEQLGHQADNVPWRQIVTSPPVWAITVAHFCENWGFYTMLTNLPKFMSDVLHYKLQTAGFLTALPYLAMGCSVMGGGQLADYLRKQRNWETVRVRKTFCCGAFICQAVFILMTAHAPNSTIAVCTITLAIGIGGLAWSGFSVNHLDLAPQYASILMGYSNTFATIPGMLSPVLVGVIVTDGTVLQWRLVLYISAVLYMVGAIVYGILAKGERLPWADVQGGFISKLDELHDAPQIAD